MIFDLLIAPLHSQRCTLRFLIGLKALGKRTQFGRSGRIACPCLPIQPIIRTLLLHHGGKLTRAQAEEIAKTKMPDLTAGDLDAAVRTIAGSARSMGVEVEGA